ncbi:hypothetical protein [Siminovitchia fordii]|uniref:Uncharacterized protein n=1 Tax=Siminovitchia fordii TaxID=254759 RepID=A0ABQ4KAJ0_9BACI|nr:hypothetical protein [Siminovitchia fordii]GIN22631.1 hypothetical protein J1TS3_37650 [Siminovitchia fordii]
MTKFAEKFWTPYSQVTTLGGKELNRNEVIGKEFIVIDEKDKNSYDFEEVGTMYIVELDGAILIEAYPEEVEAEEQKRQIEIHGY